MIKEYFITVTSDDCIEKDTFICIDLTKVVSLRVSSNNDDHCVVDLMNGDGYVLHSDYEDLLKDWQDARNIKIVRMVSA